MASGMEVASGSYFSRFAWRAFTLDPLFQIFTCSVFDICNYLHIHSGRGTHRFNMPPSRRREDDDSGRSVKK